MTRPPADAAAAHQAISAMVGPSIRVTVQIDRMLSGEQGSSRAVRTPRPAAAWVLVELDGPVGESQTGQRRVVAERDAPAWCDDEIINAARRAAERIMRQHPAWRCEAVAPPQVMSETIPHPPRNAPRSTLTIEGWLRRFVPATD